MPFCIEARGLGKTYGEGSRQVEALKNVTFNVPEGQFVSLMGPSGCGKSTLLHLLGGMDVATNGMVKVLGEALGDLDDDRLTVLRRDSIGFVFQFFHLLPTLSALENTALPLMLRDVKRPDAEVQALEMLGKVGLSGLEERRPAELSGGEQQRVALARALVHHPRLILADEPTGNLDSVSGAAVLKLLRELTTRENQTVVLATHSREVADAGDTVILLRDGQVSGIYPVGVVRP